MTQMPKSHYRTESPLFPLISERHGWLNVVGGILLPLFCLLADPVVFKTFDILPGGGGPLLGRYLVSGYSEILLGMSALVLFHWRQVISPLLSGVLLVGTVFALALGLVLLPFSLLGLLFVIGILGFSPFVSSFVFARAYQRLTRLCLAKQQRKQVIRATTLGVMFAVALPTGAQMAVNAIVDPALHRILAGDTSVETRRTLRLFSWVADLDVLVNAYRRERDTAKKEALAEAYTDVTGTSIQERLRIMDD